MGMGSVAGGIAGARAGAKGGGLQVNPAPKKSSTVKVNRRAPRWFWWPEVCVGASLLDSETRALVQRWMTAFREAPVLIDAELMRRVLDDAEMAKEPVGP